MDEKKFDDVGPPTTMMKAFVFHGPGTKPTLETVPRPQLEESTDVIIRVHKTTICGTDIHINGGNVPTCQPGRILGHEGMGHVVQVGSAVKKWHMGDRILTSCITSCGTCDSCSEGRFAFCASGGWELGNTKDGMQAEYARIPYADYTAHALPESVPDYASPAEDAYVMASDILPTGYEIGLRSGDIPNEASVAIVGTGPVGLAALLSVIAMDKAAGRTGRRIVCIDINQSRLETAREMGATDLVNNIKGDCVEQVMKLTEGKGIDFCIECIGLPVGWDITQDIVSMGGQMTILGVHGKPAQIKLEKLWQHNVSIHTGMVHTDTIPYFLERIEQGHLAADQLISHRFNLSEMEKAYEHFKNANDTGSLKVLITNDF